MSLYSFGLVCHFIVLAWLTKKSIEAMAGILNFGLLVFGLGLLRFELLSLLEMIQN